MESEAEEEAEVDVDGRTKGLMMSAFARLENGNFSESLRDVDMTLRYFGEKGDDLQRLTGAL